MVARHYIFGVVMQHVIEIESPHFLRSENLSQPLTWETIFGNENPLVLEIGCGIGDFVVKTATDNPQWNFIAIDFYNKGCWKTCRRIERHGLGNIRVLREEARQFLTEKIVPQSLRAVYINCPDPWPKKKHRKRRLVNEGFVRFLAERMAPGADFYFATDFDDYGESVAEMMTKIELFENVLGPDSFRHDIPGYHRTKYMLKFMDEGKKIYFVHYRRAASAGR
jgi:tRNA (guanine-N7-)-methyltransferase